MTAEKVRIYDIAKNLKLSNKEVMDLVQDKLKIKVKSHASTIEKADEEKLYQIINNAKSPSKPAERPIKPEPKAEQKPEPKIEPKSQVNNQPKSANFEPKVNKSPEAPKREFNNDRRPNYSHEGRPQRPFPPRADGEQRPYPPRGDGEQRPYRNDGQRPHRPFPPRGDGEQRPYTPRGEGDQRPYRNDGQRPQRPFPPRGDGEQRPYTPRGEGDQRPPFRNDGQRPQRPFPPRGDGEQRPFPPRGDGQRPNRPFTPRPDSASRPVIPKDAPTELGKSTASRRESFKKKEKPKNQEFLKEEKFEKSKLTSDKFKKKKNNVPEVKEKVTEIFIDKPLTVSELASNLEIGLSDVVKQLMMNGILATVNQVIDVQVAKDVSEKLGFIILDEPKVVEPKEGEKEEKVIDKSKLDPRAPVVTIMGHVDHGKTTLLDAIRSTKHKIVSTEVGGITQSIGAYTVRTDGKKIVFIDTPGHEAFTAMRARGAQATDIAILVVAADDGIMPQTIEAINHAKAAKVPIIVAVNKIDKAGADPDKVLQQLTEYDLIAEKWGGETICVPVSALQGTNLDELLEYILLVAEIEDLRSDAKSLAKGVIIEARLDKGKGAVATLLVQSGTLHVGDYVIAGNVGGKVRALISDEGERVRKAGPSTPVEILGLTEVPQAGDAFETFKSDKELKTLLTQRKEEERTSRLDAISPSQVRKDLISQDVDETKDLNIIIKANTHGSAEAVSAALQQLTSKQIFVKVVHIGVGDISEADVMLASASNAIVIGFSVKEDQNALKAAANEGVDIRKYDIIYQILEDIEKTMLGLLSPEFKEVDLGTAEVRQVFTVGKTTRIAGCYVTEGKVARNKIARVIRGGKEIFKGSIDQLKRFKDDVKEVATGYECGISFSKFNDLQEGDIIKVTLLEEIERASLV